MFWQTEGWGGLRCGPNSKKGGLGCGSGKKGGSLSRHIPILDIFLLQQLIRFTASQNVP